MTEFDPDFDPDKFRQERLPLVNFEPPKTRELRDYQIEYVDTIDNDPHRCVLAVMPTGGGKTSVAASMMKRYSSELKSAIFVVHRREIVHQASERLRQEGVAHGIIMAGEKDRSLDRIQVCSIQTLRARNLRPTADLIFIDEAHHVPAKSYLDLIDALSFRADHWPYRNPMSR